MKRTKLTGTKFLDKYINKRKLGKGAFGDVFLVEDEKGQPMALKMIDKKKLQGENEDMIEYLKGEIQCMRQMTGEHMVQLYNVEEDDQFYYMLMEYCDGGDLVNLQIFEKSKVFSLQKSTQYLSQVIKGLEQLHTAGYLHRDIKPQNVLLKNEDGQKILKLADFGFAKKASNLTGTCLGTEQFMSPEIFICGAQNVQGEESVYGYEVDMWAFGVLFFYMLNQDYPFKINPYWSLQEKAKELKKQATDFSYRKAVLKTKKKIEENCTDEVEDLFKKMFSVYTDKRISFSEIRQHQVFKGHFPKASQASQIIYQQKFQSTRLRKKDSIVTNKLDEKVRQIKRKTTMQISAISNPDDRSFQRQNQILRRQFQEVDFLWRIVSDFAILEQTVSSTKIVMVSYNLIKYYLLLLRKFNKSLIDPSLFHKKYSKEKGVSFKTFFNDHDFINKKKEYIIKQATAENRFQELYHKCSFKLEEIQKLNPYFAKSFRAEVEESDQDDDNFYKSYRQSTNVLYSALKQELKSNKKKELYFFLCAICICHVFNDLLDQPQKKQKVFSEYLQQEEEKEPLFSYERLVHYLKKSSKEVVVKQTHLLITQCMM